MIRLSPYKSSDALSAFFYYGIIHVFCIDSDIITTVPLFATGILIHSQTDHHTAHKQAS